MEKPLIDKWLSEGKYTCTIAEFAALVGMNRDQVRELCKSANPPPHFYSGNRCKIYVPEIEGYLRKLASRKETINV